MNNVRIYTSSERRVTASAEIFAAALLTPSNTQGSGAIPQPHQPLVTASPIATSPSNPLAPHKEHHHKESSRLIGSLTSIANAVVLGLPGPHVSARDSSISVEPISASPTAATFSTSISTSDTRPGTPQVSNNTPSSQFVSHDQEKVSTSLQLIIRKDLLDDSNEAKDLMDEVKKRLKVLLRPGEPERRPQLTWPKNLKKEPVEVVAVSLSITIWYVWYGC